MFMARHRRSARGAAGGSGPVGPVSGRQALWVNTLERRYDFHLGEAIRAAIEGSHDKATKHSGTALSISRELYAGAPDPARHQPELAAALCTHARYRAGWQAIAMLAESAGHYAELAEADPAVYEVARIDVLTRVALASDEAGNTAAAIGLLREVIAMYLKAPAAEPDERDIGLARARFQLGRCLLAAGQPGDGLAEIDTGLELAGEVLDGLALAAADPGWLDAAPRYLQLAAPDWSAAAVRSMTGHADAGRWPRAAISAQAAVLISGGLAGLGGETLRDAHAAITALAEAVLAEAGLRGGALPALVLHVALARALDLGLRRRPAGPVRALDRLTGLEVLVDLEEMLDLQPVKLGDVVDVLQMRLPRVARRHAKDLVVRALLVGHREHADHPGGHQAAGESRLLKQHQGVKRVAVAAQRLVDEPVVGGVPSRGEQHSVKPDPAGAVINLVLVPVAPGDFDYYFNVHVRSTR
jgi:tetratricopeptide (TPR) repeat protein